jgi:putative membrane protein
MEITMMNNNHLVRMAGAAATAVLLSATGAYAQSTGGTTTGTPAPSQMTGKASQSGDSQVNKRDREFMEDIAHANLAEIDTSKLALEKSQDPQVRQFAQKMIDDHTKALDELRSIAEKKGVTLPTETDLAHKTVATGLKALSGQTFDHQYIARVGVGDHERAHKLLAKVQKNALDPDLKAYADKTIKAVDQHLAMAQDIKQQEKKK